MSIKSFLIKKTLQMKGMSKGQAEKIANEMSNNPRACSKPKSVGR
jgi:hypothetical protein